jgi:hypothetical protein
MANVLMQCGCTTTAIRRSDGKPVCITHWGISPGADVPAEVLPDLTGRAMRCTYDRKGESERASNVQAAFFKHRPDKATDEFYCGCWGWD